MEPRRLLLVEDNPDDEALTRRVLASMQHLALEISVAHDGVEALEMLLAEPEGSSPAPLPDVVLMDVKMPRMSGLDALASLRKDPRTRKLPVVLFSSSDEPQDLAAGFELGANGYLQKPVGFAEFGAVVTSFAEFWLVANTPPSRDG